MNSTIVLYNVPFNEDENKLIQNIENYLKNKTTSDALEDTFVSTIKTYSNFQFIKHKLNLEIKIVETELYAPAFNANYVSITNNEYDESGETPSLTRYGGTYYYFITDITQVAENTIKLTLKCDVLNTFGDSIRNNDNWLPETFVEREHRDRFFDDDDYLYEKFWSISSGGDDYYLPLAHIKVDPVPEDIDLPLYKTNEKKVKDVFNNTPFYLVYKASTMYTDGSKPVEQIERDNAINCFLVAGSGTEIPMMNYYGNAQDLYVGDISTIASLSIGQWVFLDSEDNPDMLVQYRQSDKYNGFYARAVRQAGYHMILGVKRQTSSTFRCFVKMFTTTTSTAETLENTSGLNIVRDRNDKIIDIPYTYYVNGGNVYRDIGIVGSSNQSGQVIENVRKGWKDTSISIADDDNLPNALRTWANWKTYKATLTEVSYTPNAEIVNMKTIDDIDRTDSRIVKIIEIPYAPNAPVANYDADHNLYYTFGDNWTSSADVGEDLDMTNCFQLAGSSMEQNFKRSLTENGNSGYNFEIDCIHNLFNYIGSNFFHTRVDDLESKLQHSDFYKPVIYYDNFSIEFKCERRYNTYHRAWVDGSAMAWELKEIFDLWYAVANNIVNGIVFSISDGEAGNDYIIPKIVNYECEDYYPLTLTCIRNNELNIYNSAYLQYIRGGYNYDVKAKGLSIAMAEHNRGTAFGSAIISSATSPIGVVGALWNYERQKEQIAMQSKQYQVSIDKSLKEASLRATNVAGSDNLDLFKHYSGNCLYSATFKLNALWKNKLATLFHYFGYATNMNKVPNLTGRLFFNYVKCSPVFKQPLYVLAYRKMPLTPLKRFNGTNMEMQNEVVKKFASGVSIIHQYLMNGDGLYSWNVSQDKENWEEFLEPLKDASNFEQ